jgi:hypothetical protein
LSLHSRIGELRVSAVGNGRGGPALVTVTAAAITVASSPGATLEQRLLLAGIAIAVVAPTVLAVAGRRFDLFSAQTIFAVAFGTMFLARPVAMLYGNNFSWQIANSPAVNERPGFTTMLVAALLGAITFQVGYFLRRPAATLQPVEKIDWGSRFLLRCSLGLGFLGTLLFGGFLLLAYHHQSLSAFLGGRSESQSSMYKGSTAYLYDGMFLLAPATLLLIGSLTFGSDRRRIAGALAATFGGLLVLSTLPSGNRTALLVLLGALFVFHFLRRHKRPTLVLSLTVVLLAFFALSIVRDARDAKVRQKGMGAVVLGVFEHPGHQLGLLFNHGDTSMASAFALETEIVPARLGYRYGGATFGDLFTRPIPHLLWKGKPLAPEAALTKQLWPAAFERGWAHPVYSVMGTFYFDFGVFGVVAGMLLVGACFRWVDAHLLRSLDEGLILILAGLLPLLVVGLRQSFPDTVFHLVFTVLPLAAAVEIARRRSTLRQAVAPELSPAPESG